MKFNNTRYNTIAAYTMLVIAASLLYALAVFNLGTVLSMVLWFISKIKCVLYAFFFAFISISPMRFFERLLQKHLLKTRRRRPLVRVLSVVLTMLLILAVLLVVVFAIFPSLETSFSELQASVSPAIEATRKWIEENVKQSEYLLPIYEALTEYLSDTLLSSSSGSLLGALTGYIRNIADEASAIFLGLVLAMYSLLFRYKINAIISKILAAVLPNRLNTLAYRGVRRTYFYFMEYLSVRLLSSIYLALCSYLLCAILGVPFRSLIAILVLLFNLLPQFGGIVITFLLPLTLLVLERSYALPLFLILLVLHTLHIFAVEPFFLRKRLRPNVGLTVVLTLVFGAIFGFVGFLLAVPLYASVRSILQNRQNRRLIKRGLPIGDDYYLRLSAIDLSSVRELAEDETTDENAAQA